MTRETLTHGRPMLLSPDPPRVAGDVDTGPPPDPGSPFSDRAADRSRREARSLAHARRWRWSALRAWLVVGAMIAAAVYAGLYLTDGRIQEESELSLGTATVAATSMAIPAPADGQVAEVLVEPAEEVERGAPVARVQVFDADEPGLTGEQVVIRTPIDGVVAGIVAPEGGAVRRGGPVVQVYDPRSTVFEIPVDSEALARLARGMRVTLTSPVVDGEVRAVVDGVQPPPPGAAGALDPTLRPTVLVRPADPSQVRALVPGLELDAIVDTSSVSERTPAILEAA